MDVQGDIVEVLAFLSGCAALLQATMSDLTKQELAHRILKQQATAKAPQS